MEMVLLVTAMVIHLLVNRKGLISIHNLDGTTFEVVPFRFGIMGFLDENIHEDNVSLATDVPHIHFLMQEGICRGMHGKVVASLLVIKLEIVEVEVVRNVNVVGRTIVLPFVGMEDGPLATTMVVTNVALVQRIGVFIIKLKGKTFPRS